MPAASSDCVKTIRGFPYNPGTIWSVVLNVNAGSYPYPRAYRWKFYDSVTNIQIALCRRGYHPGPIDGIFGNGTGSAVKKFQFNNRLRVDGVVGINTSAKLGLAVIT